MKKFKNSRLSTDSRKLQTLALKYTGLVEVIVENDRGQKKSAGYKQTFRRISERLNFQWGGLK